MSRRPYVHIRPKATADVDDSAAFIAGRNLDAGLRFHMAFDQALTTLVDFPEIGASYPVSTPALDGLRFWPIPRFEYWLIFYVPRGDTIDVIRVLHAARDIPYVLTDED